MSDNTSRPERGTRSDRARVSDREEIWDLFVDELDRRGQAGSAADVLTPTTLDPSAPSGKRFGDLTGVDIDSLAKIGENLGRRCREDNVGTDAAEAETAKTRTKLAVQGGHARTSVDSRPERLLCTTVQPRECLVVMLTELS